MKAIILAGGKGTRLAPYTTIFPKPLMPLGDMPILEIIIRQLHYYGIREITIAVGHLAELIIAYFGNGNAWGVNIEYSREAQPLGTAGPLSLFTLPDEPFFVMNGDVLTTLDYRAMHQSHHASGALATVGACPRSIQVNLGTIQQDDQGRILDYIEKPRYDYLASIGIYVFSSGVREYLQPNQYLDLPDLIKILIREKQLVKVYNRIDFWLDIGRPDDYEKAQADFQHMRSQLLPGSSASTKGADSSLPTS